MCAGSDSKHIFWNITYSMSAHSAGDCKYVKWRLCFVWPTTYWTSSRSKCYFLKQRQSCNILFKLFLRLLSFAFLTHSTMLLERDSKEQVNRTIWWATVNTSNKTTKVANHTTGWWGIRNTGLTVTDEIVQTQHLWDNTRVNKPFQSDPVF